MESFFLSWIRVRGRYVQRVALQHPTLHAGTQAVAATEVDIVVTTWLIVLSALLACISAPPSRTPLGTMLNVDKNEYRFSDSPSTVSSTRRFREPGCLHGAVWGEHVRLSFRGHVCRFLKQTKYHVECVLAQRGGPSISCVK